MIEQNITQGFRLKNIGETINHFLIEIQQNELEAQKGYPERFLILASAITGHISISAFASLIGISKGITSYATGLKI